MRRLEIPQVWSGLAPRLGVNAKDTAKVWHALCACQAPNVQALVFRLAAFERRLSEDPAPAAVDQFLHTTWSPRALINATEQCVLDGLLSRQIVAPLHEQVLKLTGRNGEWLRTTK